MGSGWDLVAETRCDAPGNIESRDYLQVERDAWYRHMADAVAASGVHPEVADRLLAYFAMAADHMINAPG